MPLPSAYTCLPVPFKRMILLLHLTLSEVNYALMPIVRILTKTERRRERGYPNSSWDVLAAPRLSRIHQRRPRSAWISTGVGDFLFPTAHR